MANNEIVVGFDVSPSARAALEWAARQARSTGWTLRALHVVDWASAHNMYAMPVIEDRVYTDDDLVDCRIPPSARAGIREYRTGGGGPCSLAKAMPVACWSISHGRPTAGRRQPRTCRIGAHPRRLGQSLLRQSREVPGRRRTDSGAEARADQHAGESSPGVSH